MDGKSVAYNRNLGEHRERTKSDPGRSFLICSYQDLECGYIVVDSLILLHGPSGKWSQESGYTDKDDGCILENVWAQLL